MVGETQLMELENHISCENYSRNGSKGFTLLSLRNEKSHPVNLKKEFAIMFLISGKVVVEYERGLSSTLEQNDMCLLSNHAIYSINSEGNSDIIFFFFDRPHTLCKSLDFFKMNSDVTDADSWEIRTLKIKKPLTDFLSCMESYLNQKMYCQRMHEIKEIEFFFIMNGFYSRKEMTHFFTPMIKSLDEFTSLVKSNFSGVQTVFELADACHMTKKTFTRKFKSAFGTTPKQWMMQEKLK